MSSVVASLETRACQVMQRFAKPAQPTPTSMLEEQISLLWEHLQRMQIVHQEHLRSMLHAECYVDTDLMALDCNNPVLWQARNTVRDRLKDKLLDLARERRIALVNHERDRRVLEDRLLQVLTEHELLQG